MNTKNTKPPTASSRRRRLPRAPKLKDTCDMCSNSKVRCSKDKPVCGRCSKLGYPCSYSPARRMGRPHPFRDPALIDKHGRPVEQQPEPDKKQQNTAQPTSQSSEMYSFFGQDTQAFLGHNFLSPQSSKQWQQADISANDGDDLDDMLLFTTPKNRRMNFQPPNQTIPEVSARVQRELDEIKLFDFNDGMDSTQAIQMNGLCTPASSCDDANMYLPPYTRPTRSPSTVPDVGLKISNPSSELASEHTQDDCTTVAINTLQQLNTSRRKHLGNFTASPCLSSEALDDLLDTVSPAVKRMPTVILCPCSQNTDVCLLATAVCTSILDLYEDIITNLQLPISTSNSPSAARATPSTYVGMDANTSLFNDVSLGINDSTNFCTYVQQYLQTTRNNDRKAATTRVLEGLRKVANLVVLFAKRYNAHNRDENPVDSLPALAVELKQRVRNMTNELTDCLALL